MSYRQQKLDKKILSNLKMIIVFKKKNEKQCFGITLCIVFFRRNTLDHFKTKIYGAKILLKFNLMKYYSTLSLWGK